MKRVVMILTTVLLLSGAAMAVDHGQFGLSGEVRAFTSNTINAFSFDNRYDEPNTMIGLRFFAGEKAALDARFGFASLSAVDRDTASQTWQSSGGSSIAFEGGLMYRACEAERSYLGMVGRLGFTFNKLSEWISDPPSYSDGKYERYNVTVVSIFVGMEPTYFFNDHFSMYSTFGLKMKIIPNSKYVDYPDGYNHDDFVAGNYALKKHKDSRTYVAFDGVWIGMRYCP